MSRFLILSLPRTGSTNLVDLLNMHREIRCLSEPFGSHNYDGRFHRLALSGDGLCSTLDLIWDRWNGIKHVWDATGYPFRELPHLNERLFALPDVRFVVLVRRNLLRRWVSHYISRHINFWNGPRAEFQEVLPRFDLRPMKVEDVRRQMETDRQATAFQAAALARSRAEVLNLYYEDIYSDDATPNERFAVIERILGFLEFAPITREAFFRGWHRLLETHNRWASSEAYRRIPGIEEIEAQCGSDETGWLFRY